MPIFGHRRNHCYPRLDCLNDSSAAQSDHRTIGEVILALTWAGVDLFRRTVTVFRSKNGERRTSPVNTTVLDLLKGKYAARLGTIDFVFHSESHTPLDGSNIRRALTTALDSAKIHDLHFHDLRHTCATRMV
jgi:integrase